MLPIGRQKNFNKPEEWQMCKTYLQLSLSELGLWLLFGLEQF